MSGIAAGIAVVGAYGAHEQNNAIRNAAEGQQRGTDISLAEMKRQFDLQQNNMAPWLRAGRNALTEQQSLMGLGGNSQNSLRSLMSSPGYQFRQQQGQRSLEGGLAARGGMGSGKSMNAATEYGQNFASNEYGNRINQLAGLSGTGQNAAMGMGQFGQAYGQNVGNMLTSNANAQGAAGIAGANNRQSGVLGGAQLGFNMYDYLNRNKTAKTNQTYPGFDWLE